MSDTPRSIPRTWLFAALYFTEGAPIGLLWWALPSVLRSSGVEVSSIAMLVALIGIPWTFKFLWAPLVDLWRSERWGYRDWIVAAQMAMGLFLLPVGLGWSELNLTVLAGVLVFHAFAAATQDVAIDGLCIVSAPHEERGRLNGWMQAGMLLGRSIFGGATLVVLQTFSFEGSVLILTVLLWVSAAAVRVFVPREPTPERVLGSRALIQATLTAWRHLVSAPEARWALGFAALSGASFEAVGTLAGPFLIDAGITPANTGWFLGTVSVLMMAIGALAGGRLADRVPRRRAVAGTLTLVALSVATLSTGSLLGWGAGVLVAMALVYVSIGLFTASSYAWFMDLSQSRFAATQFSAYMGATNLCEVWSTAAGGRMVGGIGYGPAFLVLVVASLGSLEFLRRSRSNED